MIDFRFVRRPDASPLARSTRLALVGLRATLAEALSASPGDPAADEVRAALVGLDEALAAPGPIAPPAPEVVDLWDDPPESVPTPPPPAPTPVEIATPRGGSSAFAGLRHELRADHQVRSSLGASPWTETDDARSWIEIQLALLRVGEPHAKTWRTQAEAAALSFGATIETGDDCVDVVAGPVDELLWPGLSGRIKARGLRMSTKAPLPGVLTGTASDRLGPLPSIVAACLALVDRDAKLHHALRKIEESRIAPLRQGDQRERYVNELVERLKRASASFDRPVEHFRQRLELDEAIHSLVHRPVSAENSWWGKLRRSARRTLKEAADRARETVKPVDSQELIGPYNAAVRGLTKGSNDLEVDEGGRRGEVLTCLRLYAEIGTDPFPGRVLHRSMKPEPGA